METEIFDNVSLNKLTNIIMISQYLAKCGGVVFGFPVKKRLMCMTVKKDYSQWMYYYRNGNTFEYVDLYDKMQDIINHNKECGCIDLYTGIKIVNSWLSLPDNTKITFFKDNIQLTMGPPKSINKDYDGMTKQYFKLVNEQSAENEVDFNHDHYTFKSISEFDKRLNSYENNNLEPNCEAFFEFLYNFK